MKYFPVLFLLLSIPAAAQTGNSVTIGTIDSIQSRILNERRNIWVHVPGGEINTTKRYPVVYLLDGDAHFYSVVGLIHQLSSVNGNTICPEMIVVGIPNTDRTRDLTPTHVNGDPPFLDSNFTRTSGGGEQFTAFMEKELIPYIDSKYPTTPYRTLIGHSFGGLMVINTLVHHTNLFNAYLAIDPSMWWDNMKLLNETKQALNTRTFAGRSLFIGIANTMSAGMDTARVQKDTSYFSRHIRSILDLNKYLAQNKKSQLRYMGRYYNDDDHGSVPLIAEYDALRFFFDFYRLKMTADDHMNPTLQTLAKVEKHYEELSKHFGYQVKLPAEMAAQMAHWATDNKHYAEAERLLKQNIDNYPESNLSYEWMGIYYERRGDKAKAVEYYKKAYAIKETPDVKEKLEKLQ